MNQKESTGSTKEEAQTPGRVALEEVVKRMTPKGFIDALPGLLEKALEMKAAKARGEMTLGRYIDGAMIEDAHGRGVVKFERWEHLVEMLEGWAGGGNEVVLKARQIGVSWALALYAGWVGRRPGAVVLLVSQGQEEAYELLRKVKVVLGTHREVPAKLSRDGASMVEIVGGGRIIALPSTARAGRGYTAALVIVDEAAYHPYARMNYAGYKPALDGGGQHLVVSTANGVEGWYSDMYWNAEQNGYRSRFVPWSARPGRDEAWYYRAKREFSGLPAEFFKEYPNSPEEAFVALTGLVYPMWSAGRHVRLPRESWGDCKWRLAGVDFGGGDPTAVVPLGVGKGEHVHQYGEFYRSGPVTVEEIGGYLWKLHDVAPFDAILCDSSEPVAIASLVAMGLPAYAADKDRKQGLGHLAFLLENDRFTMSPGCRMSIMEMSSYRWRESTDPNSKDRYATSTPVDHHGDAMDGRRYALNHLMRSINRGPAGSAEWKVRIAT